MKNALKFQFAFAFLLIYLAGMSVYFWNKQYYNWDIEAYMGIIHQLDNPEISASSLHAKVYDELRAEAPHIFHFPNVEEKTIGANDYYRILSENPAAFAEELELFKVKPLYNWLNFAFYKLGFAASRATAVTVILSFVFIIAGIFLFVSKIWNNNFVALIIAILISLFKPLQDATRHAAPDMTAAMFLLGGFYFLFYRKNFPVFTVFAILTVFTRPEFVLLYGIFLLMLMFKNRAKFSLQDTVISLGIIAAAFSMIQLTNKISWGTLVTNQFIKVQYFPVSNPEAFDFPSYLNYLKGNILLEFNSSYFVILLLFAFLTFAASFYRFKKFTAGDTIRLLLITAVMMAVGVRFLIFPMLVNRMMVGFYLLVIMVVIIQQRRLIEEQSSYKSID